MSSYREAFAKYGKGVPMCECCLWRESTSVRSTCTPYSAAYCDECAANNANPHQIIEALLDMTQGSPADWILDTETIYDCLNRKYVSIREYYRYYVPKTLRSNNKAENG